MSGPALERRGQPLLFLGLLLVSWVLIRIATWSSPWPLPIEFDGSVKSADVLPIGITDSSALADFQPRLSNIEQDHRGDTALQPRTRNRGASRPTISDESEEAAQGSIGLAYGSSVPEPSSREGDPDVYGGGSEAAKPAQQHRNDRWRLDTWLYLRGGAPLPLGTGVRPASYGGSQAGSLLSYRFSEQVSGYARATDALIDNGETEVAAGLAVKPVPRLPVTVHAESRFTSFPEGTAIRTATFVATGFDRFALPIGFEAAGYGQAGFVSGRFTTAFADGSVRVRRNLIEHDLLNLSAGAGVWGGAQKGVSRVDVGPTVEIDTDVARTGVRLSADYRFRIAGNAQPASGPTLTILTSF